MISDLTEFIAFVFGGIIVGVAGLAFVGLVVLAILGTVARFVRKVVGQ